MYVQQEYLHICIVTKYEEHCTVVAHCCSHELSLSRSLCRPGFDPRIVCRIYVDKDTGTRCTSQHTCSLLSLSLIATLLHPGTQAAVPNIGMGDAPGDGALARPEEHACCSVDVTDTVRPFQFLSKTLISPRFPIGSC